MSKPRRKSEIRAQAAAGAEALRRAAEMRTVFRQSVPQTWHDVFLRTLKTGVSIEHAAKQAGVTRAGARWARLHDARFAQAFYEASRLGQTARFIRKHGEFEVNRSTFLWAV